jgi:type I restriction enzyme S subunit
MTRIRLNKSFSNSAWISYYLHNLFLRGFFKVSCTHHVNQASINSTFLSQKVPIPLPPLPEQRRIVTKLEELFTKLDAGVEALKKMQAQLKRYRHSILKAACEGKLVPTEAELARAEGRAYKPADVLLTRILKERREKLSKGTKYKEPAAPDTIGLTALPEGWCWATFEQIGEWNGGGTPSTRNSSYWIDGTIPWISPKDMKTLRIHDSEDKITEKALENSAARLISSGSILFVVRSGILRRTLPVALTMIDVTVNQDMKSLTPDTSIDPDYLLVTALAFNEDIRHSCAKDGTTVESLEVPALQAYAIPLPPLAEQRRIVAEVEHRLSIADGVERTVGQSLAQAQRLRQSILKRAFEGKLVAQDANDEPAGVLLERIKKERVRIEEGKRKQKQTKLLVVENTRM